MTMLVTFNSGKRLYEFDIGDGLTFGVHQDEMCSPLLVMRVIDSLCRNDWWTKQHFIDTFDVTRKHDRYQVWHETA